MWKRLKASRKGDPQAGHDDVPTSLPSRPAALHDRASSSTTVVPDSDPALRRHTSEKSAISDIHGQLFASNASLRHQRQRSQDRKDDPLGLVVLHEPQPPSERVVDILFIHGLGGTSLRTWCMNRDLSNLWPQLWLPNEDGFQSARILTYGYNAHFSAKKEKSSLAIGDFANDLLFRMKYGESGDQRLGQVPIIIVAHSMGGLLFKKAYMQGLLNEEFRAIISTIRAVLFLATPHRGTDLADTLNKVLSSSIFGHTSKDYVAELARRSPTIDGLNESFRHHASKLKIFSFYETLETTVGPISTMILDKDTAVLGYPDETPTPLIANHHDVCKFKSTDDPNYTSVVGALRSVISSTAPIDKVDGEFEADLKVIAALLGTFGPPEDDLAAGRAVRKQGTCEEFFASSKFGEWEASTTSQILWANAPPGSGKSTLCSLVIDRLVEDGKICSYFFFKYGHLQKRTISSMLRSLAYQMASQDPATCHALAELANSGTNLQTADATALWKKLFLDVIAPLEGNKDIFWVIDAVDESESGRQVIEYLSAVAGFKNRVHVLILSRPHSSIGMAMQRAGRSIPVVIAPLSANDVDIRLAVAEEMEYLQSDEEFKAEIINEITERADGNFLWASLVVKKVAACHRQEQIRSALQTTPDGMDKLYDRMLEKIATLDVAEDISLARIILSWVMYARTPLTVEELSEPYRHELSSVMNLAHTINHVCGRFVEINTNNSIALVHHSAREYLRKNAGARFSLEPLKVHEELLGKCLVALCDKDLRSKLQALKVPQFLRYGATSWAFHLENCSAQSDRVLNGLTRFFKGPFSLPWIHYLAMSDQLADLPGISRGLTAYVQKRRKVEADRPPMLHHISDLLLIENWAIDLMKIAAKFGRNLSEDPSLIYKCIPALSPSSSEIFQRFAESSTSTLSVSGTSNEEWDDCLARVSGGNGKALRLASSSLYLAVAVEVPRGDVILWDTTLLQEVRTFSIKQRVSALVFNNSGSLLACCGTSRSWVWTVKTGSILMTAQNPYQERVIELKYDDKDSLMIVTDIRRVYRLTPGGKDSEKGRWVQLSPELLEETAVPDGIFLGTPTSVVFNHDCSHIAVAYKGFPPAIWSTDPPCVVARLKRKREHGRPAFNSYTGDSKVAWNPSGTQVFGIYGDIFRWSPFDDEYTIAQDETGVVPHTIKCSPNGLVFITGDVQGSIKIYEVSSMTMIYKLTSEDGTNRISFSPDSLRFYDLRGSYCNVWEPNCLMRLADASSKKFSDAASTSDSFWSDTDDTLSTSISFPASESHVDNRPAITAIAAPSILDRMVVYSSDDGSVQMFDSRNDRTHGIGITGSTAVIEHLAYSTRYGLLALSDVYGTVWVKRISHKAGSIKAEDIYKDDKTALEGGSTVQLLFADSGELLLICREKSAQVLNFQGDTLKFAYNMPMLADAKWLQHPSDPDILISLTTQSATCYNWKLEKLHTTPLVMKVYGLPSGPCTIDSVLSSHCARLILVRTVTTDPNRRYYGFAIIPTALLTETESSKVSDTPVETLQALQATVDAIWQPVGILPDGRLVFFDRGLRLCTTRLQEEEGVSRHFFVPYDWVTAPGIKLCQVWPDGTLLCPTKGRIAVMRNDIMSKW